ncbi:MAG TPA: serine/threonine-protein kinase [Methanospirillum sp.]|nr:serine/threonine-protein kinase [Methanospirillum sp.]
MTKIPMTNRFILLCLLLAIGLTTSFVPVQAEEKSDVNTQEYRDLAGSDRNMTPYPERWQYPDPEFSNGRGIPEPEPGPKILPLQGWQVPVLSIGVSLVILMVMIIAGMVIGTQYMYICANRARYLMTACHIISTLLIAIYIGVLYGIRSGEGAMDPFVHTMYATFGILLYLALSSIIQAISLMRIRPLVPLHQAHILFSVIAIILILSIRIPLAFALQINIVTALTIITPGAAFSLITTHFIHKRENPAPVGSPDLTITRSLPLISEELPPSFPEKLTVKYHDISVIGSGGMAIVYRACRNSDGAVVALKIPFSADETSGKTFLNEMAVWRDLSHPHIARITDQNIFPVPYVELEYISRSLKDITLPVSPSRALSIISQISSALRYAHEKGVIHRDIKPGNVLISDDGTIKLTDWGLSRLIDRNDDTRNTSFSLYYASPEQLAPEKYGYGDQRTDIYQLGILLYELICGTPPYGTANLGELYTRIQKNEYVLPSLVKPELKPFDEIIAKSLQVDPDDRYQTMDEFETVLHLLSEMKSKEFMG